VSVVVAVPGSVRAVQYEYSTSVIGRRIRRAKQSGVEVSCRVRQYQSSAV
jgi:hypothetical protein